MHGSVLVAFGVASAVLQFVSMAPYFVDIARGKTKPERATWWIWSMLNVVSFAAQVGAHARWSLLLTAAQGTVTLAVAIASVKFGYGSFHRKDAAAVVFAVAGIGLWWLLNSPLAALLVVVAIDLSGYWLTLEKTWRAPETETLATWAISALSALFGVLAVGKWNGTQLMYPVYVTAGNTLLAAVILARRPKKGKIRA